MPLTQTNDGTRIAYETRGSGNLKMILLHGWGGSSSYWCDLVSHLNLQGLQVIAPSYRGHGDSGALVFSLCLFLLVRDGALLVMAAANGFFSGGQFAWVTIYLPELFPTRVRGSAISLVCNSSRIVAGLGPLVTGWLISFFGGIGSAAAMISLIYVVGLVVIPSLGRRPRGSPCQRRNHSRS
jgi:MFS family permease